MEGNHSIYENSLFSKINPLYDILFYLSTHWEESQYDLHKLLGYSNRTIGNYARTLRDLRLIYVHRVEKNSKNGKYDKNILRITFKGVLVSLCWQIKEYDNGAYSWDEKVISRIANAHHDLWEVFREWNYIDPTWFASGPLQSIKRNFRNTIYFDPIILSKSSKEISKNMLEKDDYYWRRFSNSDPLKNSKMNKLEKESYIYLEETDYIDEDKHYRRIANRVLFSLEEDRKVQVNKRSITISDNLIYILSNPTLKKLFLKEVKEIEDWFNYINELKSIQKQSK
jgi:hypothetical protein